MAVVSLDPEVLTLPRSHTRNTYNKCNTTLGCITSLPVGHYNLLKMNSFNVIKADSVVLFILFLYRECALSPLHICCASSMYAILHKTGPSHVQGVCCRAASMSKNAVTDVTQASVCVNITLDFVVTVVYDLCRVRSR